MDWSRVAAAGASSPAGGVADQHGAGLEMGKQTRDGGAIQVRFAGAFQVGAQQLVNLVELRRLVGGAAIRRRQPDRTKWKRNVLSSRGKSTVEWRLFQALAGNSAHFTFRVPLLILILILILISAHSVRIRSKIKIRIKIKRKKGATGAGPWRRCRSILRAVKPNFGHRLVGPVPGPLQANVPSRRGQHPAAVGDEAAAQRRDAGQENLGVGQRVRLGQSLDGRAFGGSAGITRRRHHHAEGRLRTPAQLRFVQGPVHAGFEQVEQVVLQARQIDFAFRDRRSGR